MTVRRFERPLEVAGEPDRPRPIEVTLNPPEEVPKVVPKAKWQAVLPLIMVVGMVGMVVMVVKQGGGFNPYLLMFPLMMVGSMGMMFAQGGGGQKGTAELNEDRKDYLIHLSDKRQLITDAEHVRYVYNQFWFPSPDLLPGAIGTGRQWNHLSTSELAMLTRIGRGRTKAAVKSLANPEGLSGPDAAPAELLDPLGMVSVSKFVKAHATADDVTILLDVAKNAVVGVQGDVERSRGLLRAMVAHLAVFNGPDTLQIAAIVDDPDDPVWAWMKWLPHAQLDATDAVGSGRAFYTSVADFQTARIDGSRGAFTAEKKSENLSHLLVVVDRADQIDRLESHEKVTWLVNQVPTAPDLPPAEVFRVDESGELLRVDNRGRTTVVGPADHIDIESATTVARRLSRFRVDSTAQSMSDDGADSRRDSSWAAILGIRDPGKIDPNEIWKPHRPDDRKRLVVPIGLDERGRPVMLDMKEAGQGGMGPHGMLIGFTGSGKSELLLSSVLSLAATHSPDELNMVLIDYKGGATFSGLDRLNHVLAVITNMEQEADLVDRLVEVLDGEGARREGLLRDAGEQHIGRAFANVTEYELFRLSPRGRNSGLEPIPAMLVVIDEFTELLDQKPEFAEAFVRIGRLGRARSMHFLLATQRYNEGQGRGLETHLSYRIALKTTSPQDSRAVIGVPDAYHLPEKPGAGYLKDNKGGTEPVRFQAPWTGGRYVPVDTEILGGHEEEIIDRQNLTGYSEPRLFTASAQATASGAAPVVVPGELEVVDEQPEVEEAPIDPWSTEGNLRDDTVRGVVLHRLAGHGRPSRQMWLPSINTNRTLDEVLTMHREQGARPFEFPVGVVDDPRNHAQHAWVIDTNVGGGHFALAGATAMGKSTVVKTMVLGAAATHDPSLVTFYIVDSGAKLGQLDTLPHVGAVARDREHAQRTLAVIMSLIDSRAALFSELGIHSLEDFRARRANRDPDLLSRDTRGDVYFVVDGYEALSERETAWFGEDRDKFAAIVSNGGSFGVHLLVTSTGWIRVNMREPITNKAELRLGDAFNAEVNREMARKMPEIPGRAAVAGDKLERRVALPRLDGVADEASMYEGTAQAVEEIASRYRSRAERVEVLPRKIPIGNILSMETIDMTVPRRQRLKAPFALRETTLGPISIDFARGSHMVIYGSAQSGKSTALASIVESLQARTSAEEAKFLLVDPRRQHMELVPDERSAGYMSTPAEIPTFMSELAVYLKKRLPSGQLTPAQRRARSWWQGPDVFLVIDDLHMLSEGFSTPFDPIVDAVRQGNDIGFHVIVTRNVQGASTQINMPFLGALKQMSASGLLLDGDRMEGTLVDSATRPMAQQIRGRGIFIDPTSQVKDTVQSGWVELPQE